MRKYFILLILFLFPLQALGEFNFPAFPMSFYGSAKLNSADLSSGTKIQAFNNNELVGEVVMQENGIYGNDNPTKIRLLIKEYISGDIIFKYVISGTSDSLTGDNVLKYIEGYKAGESIKLDFNFTKQQSSSPPSGGGSGGGGGGGGSPSTSPITPAATTIPNTAPVTKPIDQSKINEDTKKEEVKVLGIENIDYLDLTNLAGLNSEIVESASKAEAEKVYSNSKSVAMEANNKKIYDKIIKNSPASIPQNIKYMIAYFIQVGTPTTKRLGAGERAGALNSYYSAFNKFPQTVADWQDVTKIANGRWPTERNVNKEKQANTVFEKIYKRKANRKVQADDSAITIITYGLRPVNRNIKSEEAAIKTFKYIYKRSAASAVDWDIIRAIANSGAKK